MPEALADVIGGFLGLDDFHLQPLVRQVSPDYNSRLVPLPGAADFATIYNIAPLYQAGIDGTGQSIAVVGESDVLLSDIRAFRTRYGLPANDPKMVLYGGTDPGYNGSQIEGNLDLEWAGAIAPKATIYYVYGEDAFTAMVSAVDLNVAPIISMSYGGCEIGFAAHYWRTIAQQANAQGITILNSSGDSGAAGCDPQGYVPYATRGRTVSFPAVLPEVTGVGGTQFVEGSGHLLGGHELLQSTARLCPIFRRPPGTSPARRAGFERRRRQPPLSQAGLADRSRRARRQRPRRAGCGAQRGRTRWLLHHLQGANYIVSGTSASAPSLAGIVALLNQYQVAKGFRGRPGWATSIRNSTAWRRPRPRHFTTSPRAITSSTARRAARTASRDRSAIRPGRATTWRPAWARWTPTTWSRSGTPRPAQ